jgi:Mur ligase middle domain
MAPARPAQARHPHLSFLWLHPALAVILNVEHDHPENYTGLDAHLAAYARFADGIVPGGTLVINADDSGRPRVGDVQLRADVSPVRGQDLGRGLQGRMPQHPFGMIQIFHPNVCVAPFPSPVTAAGWFAFSGAGCTGGGSRLALTRTGV